MTTQAPRVGGRECPVLENTPHHCKATVRPEYLMCGRHWANLPITLRRPVWATWRAWQRASTDTNWDAYMTARAAALQHYIDLSDRYRAVPSMTLTLEDLDAAELVLIVNPDGTSRMWFGGDRDAAAKVLHTVYGDLSKDPVVDGRPT